MNTLEQIRIAFNSLATGPGSLAIDGHLIAGLPNAVIGIDELSKKLLSDSTSPTTRDQIWSRIVQRARNAQEWTIAAAGMALPGLRHAAKRVARIYPYTDSIDGDSEVLAGFLAALQEIDCGKPRICSRLCQAAFSAGRTYARRQIHAARAAQHAYHSQMPPALYGHVDLVLARAVSEGVVSQAQAELVSTTRIDKTMLAEAGRRLGLSVSVARRLRAVAEGRIVEWLNL